MISVVLVTYNSTGCLPPCIESLMACSSACQLEFIVVDNASTDGTWEWLLSQRHVFERLFANVKLMRQNENLGYAFANNRGLEVSSGDWLLLLNPDTVVSETVIDVCATKLQSNPEIGAIGCRLLLGSGELDLACRRSFPTIWNSVCKFTGLSRIFPRVKWLSEYNLTFLPETGSFKVDCVCGAFMMVPRRVYLEVGGLDEDYFMYGEDIDFCYRIVKSGYHVWYEGSVITIHYKGGNGGKKSEKSLRHFYETMWIYYQKRHPSRSATWKVGLVRVSLTLMCELHLISNRFRSRIRHGQ